MEVANMAKRRKRWNQSVYEKYVSEGRGQGEVRIRNSLTVGTVNISVLCTEEQLDDNDKRLN